jgi:histidinol-phosphatase (PHP family)
MFNLHTHTVRCKHAAGIPSDYAAAAVQKGISVLGFSDHTPLPDNRWLPIRMDIAEIDDYISDVQKAEYPQLKILMGLECEYFPEFHSFYQDILLGEKKMDYLIGSVHFYPYRGEMKGFWGDFKMDREALMNYADSYIQMIESGLFLFGAHPDTFGASIGEWDQNCEECAQRICAAAAAHNMPLEINTSGWLKAAQHPGMELPYPLENFWKVAAAYHIRVVVNSDAHAPEVLDAYMDKGYALAKRNGLEIWYPFGTGE